MANVKQVPTNADLAARAEEDRVEAFQIDLAVKLRLVQGWTWEPTSGGDGKVFARHLTPPEGDPRRGWAARWREWIPGYWVPGWAYEDRG